MTDFKIGDRVKINPSVAKSYIAPWDKRIEKGLYGTIKGNGWFGNHYKVQLDRPRRSTHPHEWLWSNVDKKNLLLVDVEESIRSD